MYKFSRILDKINNVKISNTGHFGRAKSPEYGKKRSLSIGQLGA